MYSVPSKTDAVHLEQVLRDFGKFLSDQPGGVRARAGECRWTFPIPLSEQVKMEAEEGVLLRKHLLFCDDCYQHWADSGTADR